VTHETLRNRARAMAQMRVIWYSEIFDTTPVHFSVYITYDWDFIKAQHPAGRRATSDAMTHHAGIV